MTEEERERITELKTFAWAAPMFLPLVQRRKLMSLQTLLAEFRSGQTDNLARIAELNAFDVLEREITQKQQEYTTLEKKHADNARK